MKKILILAYYYPPCNMPGANRPYGWAKYFTENGYFPVIITRSWENEIHNPKDIFLDSGKKVKHEVFPTHEVFYVPYKQNLRDKIYTKYGEGKFVFIRRILTFYELVFSSFFSSASNFRSIYYFAKKYLAANREIKILIATGAPYLLFRFAYLLRKKFNLSWVADYRDDWNTSEIDPRTGLSSKILKKIEARNEKKWVGSAAFHIAVSPFSVSKNSDFLSKKGYTVHNGYMPEDFIDLSETELFEEFTVTFVGTLYPTQNIDIFLNGFKKFVTECKDDCRIKLLFPGLAYDNMQYERVMTYLQGFDKYFSVTERVPKNEIIEIEKKTHAFLYTAHQKRGIIGSKIYEYVGLKKPVIFCPSDKETIENIFTETGVGFICNTEDEVVNTLVRLYKDYIAGKKSISFNEDKLKNIEYYSRRHQTKVLAQLLDGIDLATSDAVVESINTSSLSEVTYRICSRCVMDTSDPEIVFDENGYCNHCNSYFSGIVKLVYQGEATERKLELLLERIKKKGRSRSYDCIVGVSGGVDSIYTAYLAKKIGLRPLAVHMDNGWNSELAVSNIEKILKNLDIDLYTYVLDWEEFRELQLAFLRASVVEAETPTDIAIPAALHKVAEKYSVKYIFSGGNYATEGILPKYWHYNAKDLKYLNAIYNRFGKGSLKNFPTFGFTREMYYKIFKGIRMIYLLNYVPYNKIEAISLLKQELGWRDYGGKHHESIYTKFVQSYLLPEKFGIDYRRATFSTLICSGHMSREDAIEELKSGTYDPMTIEEEKIYICKKLNIGKEELEQIIKLPPCTYKDYPNDEKRLNFIYNIYRKIKL